MCRRLQFLRARSRICWVWGLRESLVSGGLNSKPLDKMPRKEEHPVVLYVGRALSREPNSSRLYGQASAYCEAGFSVEHACNWLSQGCI